MSIRKGRVAANRLRVWRAERHVTQLALAFKSRLAPSRISLIENRHVDATKEEREQLAGALKVDIADIFPETSEAVAS